MRVAHSAVAHRIKPQRDRLVNVFHNRPAAQRAPRAGIAALKNELLSLD
jgi:hypothetical protein